MTTLYKPVLIESAEQAEALPEGTFIIDALDLVARREKAGRCAGRWITEEDGCLDDPVMPAQALVPIEAEEETRAEYAVRQDWQPDRLVHRYVTPWESV